MKVMVIVKATASSEAGEMPSTDLLQAMGEYNEALVAAGVMKAGEGLKPSCEGKRVRFRGKDRLVIDGPFAETKELIAGYWLWQVDSLADAVEWVKRCPNPMPDESEIEIRPLFEMEDFAASDPEGSVKAQEDELRTAIAMQGSTVQPYLFFSGRCEEALEFYKTALGAKITMMMRFSESPEPLPAGMVQEGFEDRVMHASFTIGKMSLMASDCSDEESKFDGFRLALSLPSKSECNRVFDALAEVGQVAMPLRKTFWSPCYGLVTDQFGIGWMVMMQSSDAA